MTGMNKGILVHSAIGAVLALCGASAFMVGFAFALKEHGELKHEVKGSVWTWPKQREMAAALFTQDRLLQWGIPACTAFMVNALGG